MGPCATLTLPRLTPAATSPLKLATTQACQHHHPCHLHVREGLVSNLRRLKAFARTHLETGELLRQIGQRGQVPLEQIALQRRRHTEQFGQGAEPTPSQKASSRTDHANTHPPAAKLSLQHRGVRPMTVTICQPQDTRRRSCGQSSCGVCVDVTRHTSSINTEPQGQALGGSPWWRSLGHSAASKPACHRSNVHDTVLPTATRQSVSFCR